LKSEQKITNGAIFCGALETGARGYAIQRIRALVVEILNPTLDSGGVFFCGFSSLSRCGHCPDGHQQ
jgi:hypothetical protein